MSIAVIYLSRGRGGGVKAAKTFFESYNKYSSGCAHDLFVISKGWDGDIGKHYVNDWVSRLSATSVELPDDGFDWGAYFRVVRQLKHEWVYLLNTHSELCEENWLAISLNAAMQPGVGAVGATGSWGTMVPKLVWPDLLKPGIFLYPIRFMSSIGDFPAYPNPHLRSNALFVRRDILSLFSFQSVFPCLKRDAHMLESGRLGFSKFLSQQGMIPVVAGRNGKFYESKDWKESGTFRVPGQTNLLVKDNQTRNYDEAGERMRKIMEISAWGEYFDVTEG